MTSFYEFQKQYPNDEACLKRIMTERYGGTELDCPKCGVFGKFYRMTKDRGYICQHCGTPPASYCWHSHGADTLAVAQVVLCHVPVLDLAARSGCKGIGAPA